jgi:hypothetical protein
MLFSVANATLGILMRSSRSHGDWQRRVPPMSLSGYSIRDIYRQPELPRENPLKDLHAELDRAVLGAYGFNAKEDLLGQLFDLNLSVAAKEEKGEPVQAPGLPGWVKGKFVTGECVRYEGA